MIGFVVDRFRSSIVASSASPAGLRTLKGFVVKLSSDYMVKEFRDAYFAGPSDKPPAWTVTLDVERATFYHSFEEALRAAEVFESVYILSCLDLLVIAIFDSASPASPISSGSRSGKTVPAPAPPGAGDREFHLKKKGGEK